MDLVFITSVRYAEIGTLPQALFGFLFGLNLWENHNLAILFFVYWLFLAWQIPAGFVMTLLFPIVVMCMIINFAYPLPTYLNLFDNH